MRARVLRIPDDALASISVRTITSLVIRRGNRFGSRWKQLEFEMLPLDVRYTNAGQDLGGKGGGEGWRTDMLL